MPVTVPEAAPPVSKPVVLDRSKAVKPGASTDLVASVPPAGGIRTLDDTIIELLRPMIRQWLDDNMPRMVEKALRIELAASLQAASESKSDPSKH
jgi:cell pole-organizing protein PopZ